MSTRNTLVFTGRIILSLAMTDDGKLLYDRDGREFRYEEKPCPTCGATGWVSVDERLPAISKDVMVVETNYQAVTDWVKGRRIMVNDTDWYWYTPDNGMIEAVTHWREIELP